MSRPARDAEGQPGPDRPGLPDADAGSGRAVPAVKICGVTRVEDARCARDAGAAFIGAVLVPSSPRAVTPARAARIMEEIALPLVLVVADLGVAETAAAARSSGAAVLQLHGDESPDTLRALRQEGGWELWKGVRIREGRDLPAAVERFEGVVDGILVEGWHPSALGGAGARFPWAEAAPFRDRVAGGVRLIVAGGLTPDNVVEAARLLHPDIVDTSSGVERSPGVKDPALVRALIRAVRHADAAPL